VIHSSNVLSGNQSLFWRTCGANQRESNNQPEPGTKKGESHNKPEQSKSH
jgi:hypothetical protein